MIECEPAGTGISVVIPTRNRAARLRQALQSVRLQTLAPLEIIVVDDASDDATPQVLRELAAPDLKVNRNTERRGASHARNLGLAAARGGLLGLLDDDDRWRPDKLAMQSAALLQAPATVGMVCCAYDVIAEPGERVHKSWHPPDQPMDVPYFLRTTGFMTSVPLLRRACFEQVGGFDEALAGGQDLDMWIRIAERFAVIALPAVLAEHRIHGRQITTDLPAKAHAAAAILNKYRARLSEYPDLLRKRLERTALLLCAAGSPQAGRELLMEALELAPDRTSLRNHLEHSRRDPAGHAAALISTTFPSMDGIRLFY